MGRSALLSTGCWAVAASAGLILVAAEAGRFPLSAVLVCVGVLAPALLLGFVGARFPLCFCSLLYVPIFVIAALVSDEPLILLAMPVAVVGAAVMIAVGVAIGRRVDLGSLGAGAAGAAIAALAFAPAAAAYVQKHRTVRVHRSHPLLIDERHGTVAGVGVGDRVNRIIAAFGPAAVRGVADGVGPLEDTDDSTGGPATLPALVHEKNLRYPTLFFSADNRVRYLAVSDRQARLSRGVGPGDSISLVRRAYPNLTCEEQTTGADADIFYPACHGRVGPRVYAYIDGDYTRPGVPVIDIWLADFDLNAAPTGRLKPLGP